MESHFHIRPKPRIPLPGIPAMIPRSLPARLALWLLLWIVLPVHTAASQDEYWYDGRHRTPLYRAESEVAVFHSSLKDFARALRNKEIFQNSSIDRAGDYVAYLRVPPAGKELSLHGRGSKHPTVRDVAPVFYPTTVRGTMSSMVPTGNIVIRYKDQSEAEITAIEHDFGLERVRTFEFDDRTVLYRTDDPEGSIDVANTIFETNDLYFAVPDWLRERQRKSTPDDAYYAQQWHLTNSGQTGGPAGIDVAGGRMEEVWDTYRGSTQEVIAVVDDGVELLHPDLAPNLRADLCYDFIDEDADPSPSDGEPHGTSCAGLAAGRGFNGVGVTGAAPLAGLVGIRLIGAETDSNEALAETVHKDVVDIYSNSWGPYDDGDRLSGPGSLLQAAMASAVKSGRGGLGNVYVWAAGNGRQYGDNANYDGYANSRYVLAISATDHYGEQAAYSESGAVIAVNVPSSGNGAEIATTDITGAEGYNAFGFQDFDDTDYTKTFGGTSASAPTAAGIVALVLQANPNLTWREVQSIVKRTAVMNDPQDPDWTTNGAGYHINHKYGFGRIDALAAVKVASSWFSPGLETNATAKAIPGLAIPDDDEQGVASDIVIEADFDVDFVEVTFSAADHPYWGDLQVELVSPQGTVSVLSEPHYVSQGSAFYDGWRFGSVRHLGESSRGTWTLRVSDRLAQDSGTFQEWTLTLHGWRESVAPSFNTWFPHLSAGNGWTTELGIINVSPDTDCHGLLRSFNATGAQVGSPLAVNIPARGRLQMDTDGALNAFQSVSYCVLETNHDAVRGYLKYSLAGISRAAVPAQRQLASGDLMIPYIASDNSWWTGISLLNTSTSARELTVAFDNGENATIHLEPRAYKAFLVQSLLDGQPRPDIHAAVIHGAQDVIGLQLIGGGNLLAGFLLQDAATTTLIYPQVLTDAGWWTGLALFNPSGQPATATISPHSSNGTALPPTALDLAPRSLRLGFPAGLGLSPSTTWFSVKATQGLCGLEIFGASDASTMAGLSPAGTGLVSGCLPKLEKFGVNTMALVNLADVETTVSLVALDDTGITVAQATVVLPPHGKVQLPADEVFSGTDKVNATHISFSATSPVAAFQINASNDGLYLDALPAL